MFPTQLGDLVNYYSKVLAPKPVFAADTDYKQPDGSVRSTVSDWATGTLPVTGSSGLGGSNLVYGQNGWQPAQQSAPAPTSSGGSSGGSAPRGFDPTRDDINSPQWSAYRDQLAAEAEAQRREQEAMIDSIYAPQNDYLNQAESFYRNQVPGFQQEAQKNFDVNKQLATTGLQNTQSGINTQESQGKKATEDALTKARRIYQEQSIGNQQRFGGSSSAGGAISELLARNLQTEQGQTLRQQADFTQQIGQLRQQAQQKYDDSIMQLEQQKQKALNDIQREFDQKMLEITNNRTQLASAKAQMKLQALMDLRNKTFAIQQQTSQFANALGQQNAASQQQIAQYSQQLGGVGQAAQGAGSSLASNLGANKYGLQTSSGTQSNADINSMLQGQIGKTIVKKDELGRNVYSDGTAGWTNYGYR